MGREGGLLFKKKDDGISSPYKELEYREKKLKYSTFIKKVGGHATEDQKPNLNFPFILHKSIGIMFNSLLVKNSKGMGARTYQQGGGLLEGGGLHSQFTYGIKFDRKLIPSPISTFPLQ